jgi:hypothetical protein
MDDTQIIENATKAINRLKKGAHYRDWLLIGAGFAVGVRQCLHEAKTNDRSNKDYQNAFNKWLGVNVWTKDIDKKTRNDAIWCHEHEAEVEVYLATLGDDRRRVSLNHPTSIHRAWSKANVIPEPKEPREKKADITFSEWEALVEERDELKEKIENADWTTAEPKKVNPDREKEKAAGLTQLNMWVPKERLGIIKEMVGVWINAIDDDPITGLDIMKFIRRINKEGTFGHTLDKKMTAEIVAMVHGFVEATTKETREGVSQINEVFDTVHLGFRTLYPKEFEEAVEWARKKLTTQEETQPQPAVEPLTSEKAEPAAEEAFTPHKRALARV